MDMPPKLNIDLSTPEALNAARLVLARHAHDLLRDLRAVGETGEVLHLAFGVQAVAMIVSADDCRSFLAVLAPLRATYQIRARVQAMQRIPGGAA
jgi:hypothetical protein